MSDQLRQALEAAKETIRSQQEFIDQVMEQSAPLSTVISVGAKKVTLSSGGSSLIEVERPKGFEVKVGDLVSLVGQTGQIREIANVGTINTSARVIIEVVSSAEAIVDDNGAEKILRIVPGLKVEKGDRVTVDLSGWVVTSVLSNAAAQYVKPATGVSWDDLGGLEDVKAQMREIVELPLKNPAIFAHYGYQPPKGVLLSGPPGCGKTMIGKATATAIAGNSPDSGFIYVKGPEVLNKYVGESESRIRSIFDQARKHKEKYGVPAVVFIDEAESLLSRRGSGKTSDMERTIVPAFLAEMDGLEDSAAVVMLATNRPDQLDPAVVRDGRIDRKITVTRPNKAVVEEIARINISKCPTSGAKPESLAQMLAEFLMDPKLVLESRGGVTLTVAGAISGAMVANVVERAKSIALKRDLASGKSTGISSEDLIAAANMVVAESRTVDHSDELMDVAREISAGARTDLAAVA